MDILKALGKFVIKRKIKKFVNKVENIVNNINKTEGNIWKITANDRFRDGNYKKSEKYFDKAVAVNPQDVTSWYNKGAALSNQKNYHEAISCFNHALNLDPSHQEALKAKEKAIKTMWGVSK